MPEQKATGPVPTLTQSNKKQPPTQESSDLLDLFALPILSGLIARASRMESKAIEMYTRQAYEFAAISIITRSEIRKELGK